MAQALAAIQSGATAAGTAAQTAGSSALGGLQSAYGAAAPQLGALGQGILEGFNGGSLFDRPSQGFASRAGLGLGQIGQGALLGGGQGALINGLDAVGANQVLHGLRQGPAQKQTVAPKGLLSGLVSKGPGGGSGA